MNQIIQNSLLGIGSLGVIAGFNTCSGKSSKGESDTSRPNIVYILADDLGYGELGCYGQTKIETPNIDKLASEGMIFTQHYSGSAVSAPARCMLMTGLHSGKSQIRGNDEWRERGEVWDYHAMLADSSLEGQRPIKAGTVTVGRILQSVGYKTAIVGKWGLGAPHSEGAPNKQGFDFFHGYICQRQAHTYYPVHLWKNDKRVFTKNDTVAPQGWLDEGADPYDLKSYARFNQVDYSPDLMFEEITRFVDGNKNNPFFLYWASPIPHLPLQAPQKWVDYYVNKFGDEEPAVRGRMGSRNWGYFPTRYPHATYAGMISYLDEMVGKLVQQLKDLGLYENTLIIFSSDNGPASYASWFKSAAPFRSEPGYIKGSLNEGGIREPMIATWPKVIKSGSVSNHISAFYDVMPTFAEITGAETPDEVCGISFLSALKGEKQQQHEYLYWEFPESGGQMAVRIGNLKALRKNMHQGNMKWELYDLDNDPTEMTDISSKHPEVIAKVEEIVAREHTTSPNELFRFKTMGE